MKGIGSVGVARPALFKLPLDPEAQRLGVFDHVIKAIVVQICRALDAAVNDLKAKGAAIFDMICSCDFPPSELSSAY